MEFSECCTCNYACVSSAEAFSHSNPESTLKISIRDTAPAEAFFYGICFDLSDVPVRDHLDRPLELQRYRLEGANYQNPMTPLISDIMVSVWIDTQVDKTFVDTQGKS